MRRIKFVGVRFIAFGILAIGLAGFITSSLWNALMPAIFSLPSISFWQALGLLVLSRLFFGKWGGRGHNWGKARFARGMESLTPEERERFRAAMSRRFREGDAPERV
jgi:hypothetical protein